MDAPLLEPTILDLHGDGSQELPIIRSPPHVWLCIINNFVFMIFPLFFFCASQMWQERKGHS